MINMAKDYFSVSKERMARRISVSFPGGICSKVRRPPEMDRKMMSIPTPHNSTYYTGFNGLNTESAEETPFHS
jgi:hypothetical protein